MFLLANPRCVSHWSLDHSGAAALHPGGGCCQRVHWRSGKTRICYDLILLGVCFTLVFSLSAWKRLWFDFFKTSRTFHYSECQPILALVAEIELVTATDLLNRFQLRGSQFNLIASTEITGAVNCTRNPLTWCIINYINVCIQDGIKWSQRFVGEICLWSDEWDIVTISVSTKQQQPLWPFECRFLCSSALECTMKSLCCVWSSDADRQQRTETA